MPTALVSGASIAGPAVAYWLHQAGWEVTLVERATRIRGGGYPIDVRGSAAEVARRMGIYDAISAARTRHQTARILAPSGRPIASFALGDLIAGVSTEDVELPRGELTRILYDLTRNDIEYVFDNSVAAIDEHPDRVDVSFVTGPPRTFDVVIGADGIHSTTRRLAFGPEERFIRHLGPCAAIYDIDEPIGEAGVGYMYSRPGNTMMVGRGETGPARAFLAFEVQDPGSVDVRDPAAAARLAEQVYGDARWPLAARVVRALPEAGDLYFDTVSQVRMPSWSTGRVAVVGDAAFAPSFLSGQGTSIALIGAYMLAAELATAPDGPAGALRAYENRLRPFVERNQALALRPHSSVLPRTARALRRRNLKFRVAPWLQRLGLLKLLASAPVRDASNDIELPAVSSRSGLRPGAR
ncbi:FAD-dependent monooxygenase [Actinoplanes sp. NPDC089786]|uniref:FAD-dependent monooxygenase n=1 Tax=Actinoplanes sp. NPDC089786 TaxID=3155185 RepID=UPI00343A2322